MNNETNTHGNDVMSKKISNELQYIVLASILFFHYYWQRMAHSFNR